MPSVSMTADMYRSSKELHDMHQRLFERLPPEQLAGELAQAERYAEDEAESCRGLLDRAGR